MVGSDPHRQNIPGHVVLGVNPYNSISIMVIRQGVFINSYCAVSYKEKAIVRIMYGQ